MLFFVLLAVGLLIAPTKSTPKSSINWIEQIASDGIKFSGRNGMVLFVVLFKTRVIKLTHVLSFSARVVRF